jgi:hypothetical protein
MATESLRGVVPASSHLNAASIIVDAGGQTTTSPIGAADIGRFALRALLILLALFFVTIGVSMLTSALAIPFTVATFFGAAVLMALAVSLPGVGEHRL